MRHIKKILIAEDDKVSRHILANTAAKLNIATIQTSNGRICWEILRDNPDVSLLITDMMMPEMDGRELIRSLRQDSKFRELPVIIVSGIVKLHEIDDILKIGASRFLPKPIDLDMLNEYIKKLLSATSVQDVTPEMTYPT